MTTKKLSEEAEHNPSEPWPTIFTRPNITHFEEKNSRPDFQKIILGNSQVNSRLFSKYSKFLSK